MKALIASLLTTWLAFGPPDTGEPPPRPDFEALQGFTNVALTHINNVVGSERLPAANGNPVEPGVYIVISQERATIFDHNAEVVSNGAFSSPKPDRAALERFSKRRLEGDKSPLGCLSGCSQKLYETIHEQWRTLVEESRTMGVDVPSRVLIGMDAELPARLWVEAAYAASESRPIVPPRLYMFVNGGAAGLRVRPISLLPPRGLTISYSQRPLALRVQLLPGGRFQVSASDPSFGAALEIDDLSRLVVTLREVKKRYPGKETVIIDVGEERLADAVRLMVAVQDNFPRVVLAHGQPVRIG